MTFLDGVLLALLGAMGIVLAVLFILTAREDPDLWVWAPTRERFMRIMNFPEKFQPGDDAALLRRRGRRERGRRRE
ncbi:MAG: hypothetical protein ACE5OO_06085 [Candidatus Bathyarchaeia archaeon]